jgi:hypothetical protein
MDLRDDQAVRLEALERQVARLSAEVADLRGTRAATPPPVARPSAAPAASAAPASDFMRMQGAAERMYRKASTGAGASISGDELESIVGRYGTLLIAALLILMAVGVLVQVAVSRGLLTPAVRVALGALTAVVVGGAGLWFRRRGDVRYGDVLLSIALGIVDLVAWGAGPRLHLVTPAAALVVVDLVAAGIALLALHDENEFLFAVAVGGALAAPFVTSDGGGTAPMLLAYGAVVLVGSLRAPRDPAWRRAFAVLVGGAAVYALAAAGMPVGPRWIDAHLVTLFAGACALGALAVAQVEWRGDLARAFIAVGIVGVAVAWDSRAAAPQGGLWAMAVALAAVSYAALAERDFAPPLWAASAVLLPFVSVGVLYPMADRWAGGWISLAVWAAFAFGAWQFEARRGEADRGAVHLLAGGLLGVLAIVDGAWPHPFVLVVSLATWGVVLATAAARESSPLPLALGGAGLAAMDQLASRLPYVYTPFWSRSSASALVATLALAASAELIGTGDAGERERAGLDRWADRPFRLGVVVGFAILWGRMEMAHAFGREAATVLLILYYASCGLATIVAGRRLAVQRLRLAGLAMALYAAMKAMVEVSVLDGVLLRVGSYMAVGLFLLAAGYLYRVRRATVAGTAPGAPVEAAV